MMAIFFRRKKLSSFFNVCDRRALNGRDLSILLDMLYQLGVLLLLGYYSKLIIRNFVRSGTVIVFIPALDINQVINIMINNKDY
jgi:hypothetical protein